MIAPLNINTLDTFNPKTLIDHTDNTPLKVGIDVDGVLVNYAESILTTAKMLDIYTPQPKRIEHWELYPHIFEDKTSWHKAHTALMETASDMPLLDPFAPGAIATMRAAGIHVYIVTARTGDLIVEQMHSFCENNHIEVDDIITSSEKHTVDIDILYEDNPYTLAECLHSKVLPVRKPWDYNLSQTHLDALPIEIPSAANTAELAAWVINGVV
jgi:5'(3')-deoxyribonucleotidase